MALSSADVTWLENFLNCTVREAKEPIKYSYNVQPYVLSSSYRDFAEDLRREPVLDVKISASELRWLIAKLKDVDLHEHLRKTYPGVAEAWKDYHMTAMLTANFEDGKMY